MKEINLKKKKSASRRLKDAELLLKISNVCASLDTLSEVLETLVNITSQEIGCERATLFLNDPSSGELYSRFAQGGLEREIRILNNVGIAGHVFTEAEGIIVEDAYEDSRFNKDVDQQTGFKTRNILCAPIRTAKGEIIGAMQGLNKTEGQFTEEDLHLLEQITLQNSGS